MSLHVNPSLYSGVEHLLHCKTKRTYVRIQHFSKCILYTTLSTISPSNASLTKSPNPHQDPTFLILFSQNFEIVELYA